MSKKDGVKGYNVGLYNGPALVHELGPHKAEPMQPMDTTHVCTIPPTYRNDRYYSCQGLDVFIQVIEPYYMSVFHRVTSEV